MANLYTKTGDKGTTGLVGGNRVSKDNIRVECYGTIDEANAVLGLARTFSEDPLVIDYIDGIQRKLFLLAAELASDETGKKILRDKVIHEEDVRWLEEMVDQCTLVAGVQRNFVIPGVNRPSAVLHVARTVIRRAERIMISAANQIEIRPLLFQYINRLSDGIYALARLEETRYSQAHGGQKERNFNFD